MADATVLEQVHAEEDARLAAANRGSADGPRRSGAGLPRLRGKQAPRGGWEQMPFPPWVLMCMAEERAVARAEAEAERADGASRRRPERLMRGRGGAHPRARPRQRRSRQQTRGRGPQDNGERQTSALVARANIASSAPTLPAVQAGANRAPHASFAAQHPYGQHWKPPRKRKRDAKPQSILQQEG